MTAGTAHREDYFVGRTCPGTAGEITGADGYGVIGIAGTESKYDLRYLGSGHREGVPRIATHGFAGVVILRHIRAGGSFTEGDGDVSFLNGTYCLTIGKSLRLHIDGFSALHFAVVDGLSVREDRVVYDIRIHRRELVGSDEKRRRCLVGNTADRSTTPSYEHITAGRTRLRHLRQRLNLLILHDGVHGNNRTVHGP